MPLFHSTVICQALSGVVLLAEAEAEPAKPSGPGLADMIPLFAAIIFLFYMLLLRPEKKKQAQHQSLMEALKTNDRVVTIGGIYGTVANVQREKDRITLRIDETTNTKIDVTFSAIARVLVDGAGEKVAEKVAVKK